MAESGRNGRESVSDCGGVPSGLNRIRTRRVFSRDSRTLKPDELIESRSWGVSKPPLSQKQKLKTEAGGSGKITSSKKDLSKGRKLSSWFTSYLSKDSSHANADVPPKNEDTYSEIKALDWEALKRSAAHINENCTNGKQSLCSSKVSKGIKSFSHELGPRGGTLPVLQRAHSFNDLKELIGSLHSRFDTAKEVVNAELATFVMDVMDILDKADSSFEELQRKAHKLLILAQQCVEMTSSHFRAKCEIIVQDLTEERQRCQSGLPKWLLTRMLFILTRCTRILQFQKDKEPIDERSLHKFQKCIESIPAVEISWESDAGIGGSGFDYELDQKSTVELGTQENEKLISCPEMSYFRSMQPEEESNITSGTKSQASELKFPFQAPCVNILSRGLQSHHVDGSLFERSVDETTSGPLCEPEQCFDDTDTVMCRICEETVPTMYLESHSYICAYADKCDLNSLDIDDRLLKLAEILEQIIESRNLGVHASYGSPENSKSQTANAASVSEGLSPKISEWRKKGVEGMFEDIHEMDTAFIDESLLTSIMKGNLGMRLGNHGASSSTGSMTSLSSTSTPRAGHFDSFWLEINNPSELEEVQQMIDLADIARCVATTDISQEGSNEFLLACMHDLQDVLQHSKIKALVIDTFGGRIEKLLREKYILAGEVIDATSLKYDSSLKDSSTNFLDNGSQGSALSTAIHSSNKERMSIDHFEIMKPISRGAFGKVYLARKRTTGDLFAIKVLKKLDMIRKNDIDRILAERNILITVRNPFVVRFFYSFTCRDNLYLVMEYLNGGDLYSLLSKVGCLEEDVARIYLAELVLALEYLHSLGIVHRDLKPDNILIAHDGHIKLTDFGLSKIGLINSTINLSGPMTNEAASSESPDLCSQQIEDRSRESAVGTPDYLAPEILLGTEHGYAADWWSAGIILFELLTGIPPFAANCPEIIFDNILNRKIPWPNIPTDMSHEAQDLIDRFLVHDPNQRLGANGAAEVKAHPFFKGINWDNLALQKAAFVPHPESADDTSYFVSRWSQISVGISGYQNSSGSPSETDECCSDSEVEVDKCGDLTEFRSSPIDLSSLNFSFKNLSQLASINHDLLLQTGKEPTKSFLSEGQGQ